MNKYILLFFYILSFLMQGKTTWINHQGGTPSNENSYSESDNYDSDDDLKMIKITLDDDNTVTRPDVKGYKNLGWIVKYNGEQVLDRNAKNELSYTYYRKDPGTYEIYVTALKNGKYVKISNTVTYTIEEPETPRMMEITLDDDNTVTRPDAKGYENLGWMVKYNGKEVLHRIAENELSYKYFGTSPGKYEIYVTAWKDGEYVQVSNTVRYSIGNTETSETPEMIEVTLLDDYTVARSDMSGYENLGWIVKYNGEQVLHRNAEDELRYTYYKTMPGTYEIYVAAWKDGEYVPVSNTVTYTIENDKTPEMIEITLDDENTVTRPGVSGYKNLGWIVKYNGEQVLDRNAKNELSYTYYRTDPGTYEIYVTAWKDGKYVQVSNTVTYTIQ